MKTCMALCNVRRRYYCFKKSKTGLSRLLEEGYLKVAAFRDDGPVHMR